MLSAHTAGGRGGWEEAGEKLTGHSIKNKLKQKERGREKELTIWRRISVEVFPFLYIVRHELLPIKKTRAYKIIYLILSCTRIFMFMLIYSTIFLRFFLFIFVFSLSFLYNPITALQ